MNHLGTKTLETERLILRKAKLDDVNNAFSNWVTDSDVTKYLRWKPHENKMVTRDVFSSWIKEYENKNYYNWIIELKEIKEPIGTIGVVKSDEKTEMVHVGYALGKSWWNNGIMSEALKRVIQFFFEEVGVNRVESMFDPKNIGSGEVMKKCKMKYEGTLRQADFSNQGIIDAAYYGIIAEDYFESE